MRGVVSAVLVTLAAIVWSAPVAADPPDGYPFVAFDQGLKQAQKQGKPIFVYFGRYGCGWCDKTNKEAFSVADVRQKYIDHYVLVYVDAESGRRLTLPSGERITERELGVKFKAFATPLFAFLEPDGSRIFKIAGIQSARDLTLYDRFVNEGIYRKQDIESFLSANL